MKLTLLLAVVLAAAASAQLPGLDLRYGDRPPRPRFAAIAVETGSSLLGGALLGGGAVLATKAAFGSNAEPFPGVLVALGAGAIGYCAGSSLGCWAGGSLMSEQGRFGGTMLGSLAGTAVGLGLGLAAGQWVDPPAATYVMLAPAMAAPVAGAVIGYNLSRPCTDCGITRRVSPPSLGIALTEDAAGRPMAAPRLQLVGFAI